MNHLFVSYSRKDAPAVMRITDLLREDGVKIWQDVSGAGTGIPFSTKWSEVIEEAIHLANGAIIFRSDNWEDSKPCEKEFDLIKKCDIPYLDIDPAEADADPQTAIEKVRRFLSEYVSCPQNDLRTRMISSAYEYKAGVDPYQLIPRSRGKLIAAADIIFEMRQMDVLAAKKNYKSRDPEIYPYIKKYIRFSRRTAVLRISGVLLTALMAIAAVLVLFVLPISLGLTVADTRRSFAGMAAAAKISQVGEADPVRSAEMIEEIKTDTELTSGSCFSLFRNGVRFLDARLPARMLTKKEELLELTETAAVTESRLFSAQLSDNAGSITVTEKATGERRTLNAPCAPSVYAWNADGNLLVYAAGNGVFVYNASTKNVPIRLFENYQPIQKVLFTEFEDRTVAAAVTSRGVALLWDLPEFPVLTRRSGIDYGFITDCETAEAVFIDGNDIVISRNGDERVISPDIKGTIYTPYYDVAPDGSRIAFICENEGKRRIVCVSLDDGRILTDAEPLYTPTAVAFSADGSRICASAEYCAIMQVDVETGEIQYGAYDASHYYYIKRCGDNWILTDLYGLFCVMDGSMKKIRSCGSANYAYTPIFDLAADAENGYAYTVNRGGAHMVGCGRLDIEAGKTNLIVVPDMELVDSNTAVALSEDGRYVAFGYPNGTVRVYGTEKFCLVYETTGIGESVSAIRFAPDCSALCILGSGGNVYRKELPAYELSGTDEDVIREYWMKIVSDVSEKKNAYIDMIKKQINE